MKKQSFDLEIIKQRISQKKPKAKANKSPQPKKNENPFSFDPLNRENPKDLLKLLYRKDISEEFLKFLNGETSMEDFLAFKNFHQIMVAKRAKSQNPKKKTTLKVFLAKGKAIQRMSIVNQRVIRGHDMISIYDLSDKLNAVREEVEENQVRIEDKHLKMLRDYFWFRIHKKKLQKRGGNMEENGIGKNKMELIDFKIFDKFEMILKETIEKIESRDLLGSNSARPYHFGDVKSCSKSMKTATILRKPTFLNPREVIADREVSKNSLQSNVFKERLENQIGTKISEQKALSTMSLNARDAFKKKVDTYLRLLRPPTPTHKPIVPQEKISRTKAQEAKKQKAIRRSVSPKVEEETEKALNSSTKSNSSLSFFKVRARATTHKTEEPEAHFLMTSPRAEDRFTSPRSFLSSSSKKIKTSASTMNLRLKSKEKSPHCGNETQMNASKPQNNITNFNDEPPTRPETSNTALRETSPHKLKITRIPVSKLPVQTTPKDSNRSQNPQREQIQTRKQFLEGIPQKETSSHSRNPKPVEIHHTFTSKQRQNPRLLHLSDYLQMKDKKTKKFAQEIEEFKKGKMDSRFDSEIPVKSEKRTPVFKDLFNLDEEQEYFRKEIANFDPTNEKRIRRFMGREPLNESKGVNTERSELVCPRRGREPKYKGIACLSQTVQQGNEPWSFTQTAEIKRNSSKKELASSNFVHSHTFDKRTGEMKSNETQAYEETSGSEDSYQSQSERMLNGHYKETIKLQEQLKKSKSTKNVISKNLKTIFKLHEISKGITSTNIRKLEKTSLFSF